MGKSLSICIEMMKEKNLIAASLDFISYAPQQHWTEVSSLASLISMAWLADELLVPTYHADEANQRPNSCPLMMMMMIMIMMMMMIMMMIYVDIQMRLALLYTKLLSLQSLKVHVTEQMPPC